MAGLVAGSVYTVLPVAEDTKAVKFEPLNNCNRPAIEVDPPIPTPPDTVIAPVDEDVDAVELVILTVPPIFAFPVTPNPPKTTNDPVAVEDEFIEPLPIWV